MIDGEAQLIQSAIRGKASAFGSLYDHYQPQIYRFVLLKVSRREDAEDLTHQVFFHAFQNIERYENLGFPFSSWLYRIARNQTIDFYRTRKKDVGLDDIDQDLAAHFENHEDRVDQNIKLGTVMAAIGTLKPEYQDVVIMRFIEDLPIRDVAHALEKSEGAVKLIQHRAIGELKKILSTKS